MKNHSSAYQGNACTHTLLLVGASTAVLAIVFSGLWLLHSHLTLGNTNCWNAGLPIAAGMCSLLALFKTTRYAARWHGFSLLALVGLFSTLWLQGVEPIFLWIVGVLLCVHAGVLWLFLRPLNLTKFTPGFEGNRLKSDPAGELTIGAMNVPAPVDLVCDADKSPVLDLMVVSAVEAAVGSATVDSVKSQRRGNRLALLLIVVAFVVYMVVVPVVGQLVDASRPTVGFRKVSDELTFAESFRLHSVSGIVMLMFLAMGASIGSFLNVVIYRLPRRKALLWPPSSCSDCGARIAGQDNVPILGWVRLGGKCRKCYAPVSIRYPIVESIVGAMFVLFFYHELLTGGGNLPIRQPNSYRGIVWILLYTKWDLVGIYFFHMFVLTVLLAWGMVNWDLFRVPSYAAALIAVLVVAIASASPIFNPALVHFDVLWLSSNVAFATSLVSVRKLACR